MDKYLQERVKLTSNCHDCDVLPKVENAGCVIDGNPQYQVMHNGIKVSLGGYHGKWMQEIITNLKGHHEPQEEKAFYEVLKYVPEGGIMIELGSYWAYYSMWFHQYVKNSVNYMVEPNKEKLKVGVNNFRLNNMDGNFINASIGSISKKDNVFIDWDGSKALINQITLDKIIKDKKINYIDLLHADIQGAELEMLLGAKLALEMKCIRFVFISTHGYCHSKCIKMLKQYEYDVICEHSIAESFSADGLIVAKSPLVEGPKRIIISRANTTLTKKTLFRVKEAIHSLRSN